MKQKIGVIGSGSVGQSLATGFLNCGYQVMIGSRDLSKLSEWKSSAGEGGSIGVMASAWATSVRMRSVLRKPR